LTRFNPDWVSPPGATIADILQERGLTVDDLAERTGLTPQSAADLIEGREPITAELARRLESALGAPAAFWLRREAGYRR
jgi:HTH-type transcriptional regulator/antitoxin HigA